MNIRSQIENCGGRRFLMTVGCSMVTALLTWFGRIDGDTYEIVIIATVAAYITGNTAQKIKVPAKESQDAQST